MRDADSVEGYFTRTARYFVSDSSVLPASASTSPCLTISIARSASVVAASSARTKASSASSCFFSFASDQPSPSLRRDMFFASGHVSNISR